MSAVAREDFMSEPEPDHDLAISFSGKQREEALTLVRACERKGLTVFYDRDYTDPFVGKFVISEIRKFYNGKRSRLVVALISQEYLDSGYPMDELRSAISYSVPKNLIDYVLPILFGEVSVPTELLNPAMGFLRFENHSPDDIAAIIAECVRRRMGESGPP